LSDTKPFKLIVSSRIPVQIPIDGQDVQGTVRRFDVEHASDAKPAGRVSAEA
jgi:hypothetical protein